MRKLLDNCFKNFGLWADLEDILSVDEQMVPFKGRLAFKVYMRDKPIKRGIKIFALAGQSGYIHRFYVLGDTRPLMPAAEADELEPTIGISGQTVLALLTKPFNPPGGCQVVIFALSWLKNRNKEHY